MILESGGWENPWRIHGFSWEIFGKLWEMMMICLFFLAAFWYPKMFLEVNRFKELDGRLDRMASRTGIEMYSVVDQDGGFESPKPLAKFR